MKKIRKLLIAALTALMTSNAIAADQFYDALSLAIQHFNGKHDKDIRSGGPEHKFMQDLLSAVDKAVPAVAGITGDNKGSDYDDPYRFLKAKVYFSNDQKAHIGRDPKKQRELAESLKTEVMKIVDNCIYRKGTSIEENQTNRHSKTVTETTVYSLSSSFDRQCSNTRVTKALVEVGLDELVVKERITNYGTDLSIYLGRNTNLWRDMAYVKKQALQIDAVKPLIEHLEVIRIQRVGRNKGISLAERAGDATFSDPVRLRYWRGWGDCPAGCIHRHSWHITATPKPNADGSYAFDVEVTEESGNPLPSR